MADSDTIQSQILGRSQQPASATVDGRSATGHSLKDLIAAHRYLKSLEDGSAGATADGYVGLGVRTARIEPGGAA